MTERFALGIRHAVLRAGGVAALLALAACANGGDGPSTTTGGGGTTTTANNDGTGQALGLANCPTPPQGRVHFKLNDAVLAVPGNIVVDAIPATIKPPLSKEKVIAEVQSLTNQGFGCPGKPMETGLLLIKDDLGHPLLDGNMGLLAMPPGGITARFAEATKKLQDKPAKGCQPIPDSDLIACAGSEKRGEVVTEVLYVITTKKNEKMGSGGPLAVRCLRKGEAIEGCNLVDQAPGGVAFDVSLKSGVYNTAGLRGALDAAAAKVNSLRVGGGT